jgi:diguanylate cyclase (GGDEF)-like protein/PAS domain S-box-containing protein
VQDREAGIQLVNDAFVHLFQYIPLEVIGRNLEELIVPADLRNEYAELIRQVNSGQTVHRSVRRMRKDKQEVHVEVHIVPIFRNTQVQGCYVIYKDISDQIKAGEAAREHAEALNHWISELQLRTMQITLLNEMGGLLQCAENSEEAYAIVRQSASKLFVRANTGALFILKPSRNALEAKAFWGNPAPEPEVFYPNDCWALRRSQPHWSECPTQSMVCAHVDNSLEINYLCVPMVAHGETLGVLHLRCDIDRGEDAEADQKFRESLKRLAGAAASEIALSLANVRLRETLREQSIRDPLTGLFNRRFMQESFDRELQRARRKLRPLAVLFLDLDHFKHFNDIFGHDAGDMVLQSLADLFRSNFRSDDIICRYGGEEFAIILPESSTQDALTRAEALRLATKDLKLVHHGRPLDPVTLSIGIAGFPDHGESSQELLDRADKCLYQSKAKGRDRVTLARDEVRDRSSETPAC